MPSRPASPLLNRPALVLAAVVCGVLAAALMLPTVVHCKFASEESVCLRPPGLRAWLAVAGMLFVMWWGTVLSHGWLPRDAERRRWGLAAQIVLLTVLGTATGVVLHRRFGGPEINFDHYNLQVQATLAACACLALEYHQRGRRQQADAESLRQQAQAQARQLDEARAALLQAQVEPHFLFNTLAHLRRLAHTDAAAARGMLAELRRYLDAALPDLRQAQTPLARELELVTAFLALHQRRIGPERLSLRYEIAPGLDDIIVPSTCLLTLAENAVKHGIGPQVDGGEICVRAGRDPEDLALLRLEVADTGAGMSSSSGSGTGLATLRARLASAYGGAARLSLHLNQPRGLIARVQLPWP
jgi:sensor histidine kinase YesM